MNGELVGEWRRSAVGGQEFQYAAAWLTAAAAVVGTDRGAAVDRATTSHRMS
jgi:hypothetical protein